MTDLPACETLDLRLEGGRLDVTLNRPQARNAMSLVMVDELEATLDAVRDDRGVRVIVLRGAGGNFCAGGDVKDMAAARAGSAGDGVDPLARVNRRFGGLLMKLEAAPQATVAALEGAVMGGGFGVACVTDVAVAVADAKLRLP